MERRIKADFYHLAAVQNKNISSAAKIAQNCEPKPNRCNGRNVRSITSLNMFNL